jgi:hypothetical protein
MAMMTAHGEVLAGGYEYEVKVKVNDGKVQTNEWRLLSLYPPPPKVLAPPTASLWFIILNFEMKPLR